MQLSILSQAAIKNNAHHRANDNASVLQQTVNTLITFI